VSKAKEFMAANLKAELTADDIAQSLGVSYRVLNYAFRDAFGVSPYLYVLTEKLHAVRRQLKSTDVSVTEASVSHGLYTPSRFTRQYKRLFGEFPSETRNQK
jgi:transcriptional regulator GlxA family with amidase domain